jgi:exodeoxyribonuclease VII small subunit
MPDPAPAPQTPPAPLTFEQALVRLEAIVQQLEDGRTDLASSLAGYEEGVRLLRQCHQLLEKAERRIEILAGVDSTGAPITEPFDDESTLSLEEKAQTRSKRRSTKKSVSEAGKGESTGKGDSAGGSIDPVDGPGTLF